MAFAVDTKVSIERSRLEIETILKRYGATGFSYGWVTSGPNEIAQIQFLAKATKLRFLLPLPTLDEFRYTKQMKRRSNGQMAEAHEQAKRSRWRALALIIKAKLEAVDSGIVTFEEEFLAHIVLPNDRRLGDEMLPQLTDARDRGVMPQCLGFEPK